MGGWFAPGPLPCIREGAASTLWGGLIPEGPHGHRHTRVWKENWEEGKSGQVGMLEQTETMEPSLLYLKFPETLPSTDIYSGHSQDHGSPQ